MPFDSQGKFTRLHSWEQDRIDDIDIVSDHHDEEDDNFADGLNECLLRSGLVPMEGNLNLGGFKLVNMGAATSEQDAVNRSQLNEAKDDVISQLNQTLCVGDIKCSALQEDHKNWLLCDGRELERSVYEDLFAAIGTAFGSGNDVTTFNIPDCRGVAVRGCDNGRGLDKDRVFGSYQDDGAPNITATFRADCYTSPEESGAVQASATGNRGGDNPVSNQRQFSFDASRSSAVYGRSSELRMKNIALNYFIKAKED